MIWNLLCLKKSSLGFDIPIKLRTLRV